MGGQDGMESIGEKEQENMAFRKYYVRTYSKLKTKSAPNCVMVPFYILLTYIHTYVQLFVQLSSSSEMVRK